MVKMLFASSAFETVSHVVFSLFHVYSPVHTWPAAEPNEVKRPCGGSGDAHKVRLHTRLKV